MDEREDIVYFLEFEDVERWRELFKQELEVAMKAAEEVKERLPVGGSRGARQTRPPQANT